MICQILYHTSLGDLVVVDRNDKRSSHSSSTSRSRRDVAINNTNYSTTHIFGDSDNTLDIYMHTPVETKWVFLEKEEVGDEAEKR